MLTTEEALLFKAAQEEKNVKRLLGAAQSWVVSVVPH